MNILAILIGASLLLNGNCELSSERAIAKPNSNFDPGITKMERYERYLEEPIFEHFPTRDA